jgi:hypothetical protein
VLASKAYFFLIEYFFIESLTSICLKIISLLFFSIEMVLNAGRSLSPSKLAISILPHWILKIKKIEVNEMKQIKKNVKLVVSGTLSQSVFDFNYLFINIFRNCYFLFYQNYNEILYHVIIIILL